MNELTTQPDVLLVPCPIQDIWNPRNYYEEQVRKQFELILTKFGIIELANELVEVRLPPKSSCGFSARITEVTRMWNLMQSIRRHGFQPPPGDEIMVRADSLLPHGGTHRAAILRSLGMSAPAIVITNWKTFRPIRREGEPPWRRLDS